MILPGESQGRGAWWAAVYGVAQSRTRLKRLSSSIWAVCLPSDQVSFHLPGPVDQAGRKKKLLARAFSRTLRLKVGASLVAQLVKNPPAMRETWV